MKTIAFLPLTRTNWFIMVRLARFLGNDAGNLARPLILLSNPLTRMLAAEVDADIPRLDISGTTGMPHGGTAPMPAPASRKRVAGMLRGIGGCRWLTPLLAWYRAGQVGRQLRMARQVLDEIRPQALVVAGDRNAGMEPPMLRAARERGIVTIIPPSAFSATLDGLFIGRRQHRGHYVTRRPDFKRRFPDQWRHDPVSGEDISYFGIATTYAYDRYGMLPANPWVLGGGLSDWILVDSEDVRQRYIDRGVDPGKIVVTGHPDHDELAASLRQRDTTRSRIVEKYGLDPARRIIVLCLPNWGEVGLKGWDWHWRESELLCRCAVQQGCNVLLSLHPSQDRASYAYLEERFPPLRILDERLAAVLPASDIYFTGLASSTIPWAVLSTVPTVIADHYPEKDRIHLGLPGVIYVPDAAGLGPELARLVDDEAYFQDNRRQQQETGHLYGRPDGQAMQRIVATLLTARPHHL